MSSDLRDSFDVVSREVQRIEVLHIVSQERKLRAKTLSGLRPADVLGGGVRFESGRNN